MATWPSVAIHHDYRGLGVAKQRVNKGHSHSTGANDPVVGHNPFSHVERFTSVRVECGVRSSNGTVGQKIAFMIEMHILRRSIIYTQDGRKRDCCGPSRVFQSPRRVGADSARRAIDSAHLAFPDNESRIVSDRTPCSRECLFILSFAVMRGFKLLACTWPLHLGSVRGGARQTHLKFWVELMNFVDLDLCGFMRVHVNRTSLFALISCRHQHGQLNATKTERR